MDSGINKRIVRPRSAATTAQRVISSLIHYNKDVNECQKTEGGLTSDITPGERVRYCESFRKPWRKIVTPPVVNRLTGTI